MVSSVFMASRAAPVIAWAITPSAMPLTWEVWTSIVAGAMSATSVLENEVARREKSSGMVTTAAYVPAASPAEPSSVSVSTQSKLLRSSAPLTSPPAS